MTQLAREFSDFQIVSTLSAQLPWLAFPEVLWILAALRFLEAPRSFGEMLTPSQGTEELWGCGFFARGGIPGCDFLPAEVFRTALRAMGAPLFWRLWHSVQAMPFPFLAFVAFGTGKGLLRYGIDTRCAKQPPVVRDAFSEALRAQNRLLGYGRDIRYRKRPPTVRDAFSKARNSRLRRLWTASCCTGHIFRGTELPPATPNAPSDVLQF